MLKNKKGESGGSQKKPKNIENSKLFRFTRYSHNPEVVWFKSHPRNQVKSLKSIEISRFFGLFLFLFRRRFWGQKRLF